MSERIYDLFSKTASIHEIDENTFDNMIKNALKEHKLSFNELTSSQSVYLKYIDLIEVIK